MDLERIISSPVIERPFRVLSDRRLLVLAYHGVDDVASFRAHMEWLVTIRRPITIDEVQHALSNGGTVPRGRFLATFDDGHRSVLTKGLPILKLLDIPAALFVVTGLIGTAEPYWWDEVEELSTNGGTARISTLTGVDLVRRIKTVPNVDRLRTIEELRDSAPVPARPYPHLTVDELRSLDGDGVTIGSHSVSHPLLDQCPDEHIRLELKESRRSLEEWLERPVSGLAYPNGNVDDRVVRIAGEAGYQTGFLFDHRLGSGSPTNPLRISRVRVDSDASLARFKAIVSGFLPIIHHLRRRP